MGISLTEDRSSSKITTSSSLTEDGSGTKITANQPDFKGETETIDEAVHAAVADVITDYALSMQAIAKQMMASASKEYTSYTDLLTFNRAVRDLFLDHLAGVLMDFETFVVPDSGERNEDEEAEEGNCGLEAFDKVGFLSDCPETHMAFLSAFLETQMFATFLDMRLVLKNSSAPTSKDHLQDQCVCHRHGSGWGPLSPGVIAFLTRVARGRSRRARASTVEVAGSLDRRLLAPSNSSSSVRMRKKKRRSYGMWIHFTVLEA